MITLPLCTAGFLIVLSLIFSATESAFLSLNKLRVRFLRNQKDKRAIRVWRLLNNKERLINTLLVGNNIVNIAISSLLTYVALKLFGNAGVGLATFVATLLLLVFGEISPKTIATRHPEPIAFAFSGLVLVLEVLLAPIVFILTGFSRLVLKLFGVSTKKKAVSFTEEEIKTFIDVGAESGVLETGEKNMMRRVFLFTDLAAKNVMIPRKKIIAIPHTFRYKDIIEHAQRFRMSRFPVYRNDIDDIVGILYVRDLLVYKNQEQDFSLQTVMKPPLFVLETKKMSDIQRVLKENHQSMAIVIDEYSGTEGLITSEHIAREIFGSSDVKKPVVRGMITSQDDAEGQVSGLTRLTEINERFGLHIESEYSETIGGYVCELLGHIPRVGEAVADSGFIFTVKEMDENRVAKVEVREA